ncbi:Zinc finger protein CONSTANS-LIKE 5 [Dendrobium catenatum]|uniref:Zinc finger protein CONSTANS-LIKE 5 n=1 Tax=Dendrobium catenatum TaxID=906689 RepID=A0A2I0WLH7_9ASPA|nr:Zinc finger protein CONSTANS-LIKE 5 [Dendrobium catenatum]
MFHSSYSSSTSPPSYNAGAAFTTFLDAGGVGGNQPPPLSLLSSSFPSSYFLQRSSSSHSLPLPSTAADPRDFHGFHTEPVRRVFSAGDLQCMNGSIASADSSHSDAAGRIGRYSAEERRERIERYRTKRNQRNFHKKITVLSLFFSPFPILLDQKDEIFNVSVLQYACRKTLADSRPRVRGRFARNGDTEHETEAETESMESGFDSWNAYGVNGDKIVPGAGEGGGDWWRQMQAALVTTDEEESGYDEDIWASFESVFAMN